MDTEGAVLALLVPGWLPDCLIGMGFIWLCENDFRFSISTSLPQRPLPSAGICRLSNHPSADNLMVGARSHEGQLFIPVACPARSTDSMSEPRLTTEPAFWHPLDRFGPAPTHAGYGHVGSG